MSLNSYFIEGSLTDMNDGVAYKRVTTTVSNEHSYCLYCYETILINLCEGGCVCFVFTPAYVFVCISSIMKKTKLPVIWLIIDIW